MGAPSSDMEAAEQPAAENLLGAFKRISASDRGKHVRVLNYWLSIRGEKEFPSLHDLDPLKLSDAAPNSVLLELISGGHDAEIRHIGQMLKAHGEAERLIDAPRPSILACIANKLPIVAISRDFLAFEDDFPTAEGTTRCWVTLLPLSAGGAWVDYVYALVSFDAAPAKGADAVKTPAKKAKAAEPKAEEPRAEEPKVEEKAEPTDAGPVAATEPEPVVDAEPAVEEAAEPPEPVAEPKAEPEPVEAEAATEPEPEPVEPVEAAAEPEPEPEPDPVGAVVEPEPADVVSEAPPEPAPKAGFSKLLDNLAGLTGFYGSGYKFEPLPAARAEDPPEGIEEPVAETPADEPAEAGDEPPADETPPADEPATEAVIEDPPVEERPVETVAEDAPPIEERAVEPAGDAPTIEEPPVEEPAAKHEPADVMEGTLQSKLTEVRAKADEARQAKLRANIALYEGLGAAYDFALDAEDAPEEYLRLVEAQGLKIQLRSPMKPVVKLAFDGLCDDITIRQLEAVLAWALDNELPRGSLAERIETAGGIARILNGDAKAA